MSILTNQEMGILSRQLQEEGNVVVFTNGCFDIIHRGHIELFKLAKLEGDVLFVGINGDRSVMRLKGKGRPFMSAFDRAIIVDTLNPVDHVTIFEEDTPKALISLLQPNVLVKGADYDLEKIVGAKAVEGWGGKVVRIPLVKGKSTSRIWERINQRLQGENT